MFMPLHTAIGNNGIVRTRRAECGIAREAVAYTRQDAFKPVVPKGVNGYGNKEEGCTEGQTESD